MAAPPSLGPGSEARPLSGRRRRSATMRTFLSGGGAIGHALVGCWLRLRACWPTLLSPLNRRPTSPVAVVVVAATWSPRSPTILIHPARSEEHTSELQSLMRISYAVF